jgi:hypothetical protein
MRAHFAAMMVGRIFDSNEKYIGIPALLQVAAVRSASLVEQSDCLRGQAGA